MNVGREVGEVISINTQTLSWASKSFSNSLFSFFIADCLSPSVSVKCPVLDCYTYHHVALVCVVGGNFSGSLKKCPRELLVVFFFPIVILMK